MWVLVAGLLLLIGSAVWASITCAEMDNRLKSDEVCDVETEITEAPASETDEPPEPMQALAQYDDMEEGYDSEEDE